MASTFRRAAAVAAVAALAIGGAAAPGQAQTAAPDEVFAVVGTNGALYSSTTDGARYTNLGGRLVGDPTVVRSADGRTFYVGQSTNGGLYVRTDTEGWARLAPAAATCSDPDAELVEDVLYLACRGANNRLYYAEVALPARGLPFITRLTNLGGVLVDGPGLDVSLVDVSEEGDGSELEPFAFAYVLGRTYGPDGENVYATTPDFGGDTFFRVGLACTDAPALVTADENVLIGCASAGRTLFYSGLLEVDPEFVGDDEEFIEAFEAEGVIPGAIRGRPGLAILADGTATATATGINRGVYRARITAEGNTTYTRLPGAAVSGVGAAAVVSATPTPPPPTPDPSPTPPTTPPPPPPTTP